jgi:hypothetical protein
MSGVSVLTACEPSVSRAKALENFPRFSILDFFSTAQFLQTLLSTVTILTKMASKTLARSLRAASKQKISAPSVQKRSIASALLTRPVTAAAQRPAFSAPSQQQTRGVKTIDFAGTKETVFGMQLDYCDLSHPPADLSQQSERTGPARSSWYATCPQQ